MALLGAVRTNRTYEAGVAAMAAVVAAVGATFDDISRYRANDTNAESPIGSGKTAIPIGL